MTRFSILSLFVFITSVAVCISIYMQYRQSAILREQSERITLLENNSRINLRLAQLLSSLDLYNPEDIDTHKLVSSITAGVSVPTTDASASPFSTPPMLIDVDGVPGGLEILSLHRNDHFNKGETGSVLALFNDNRFVDVTMRFTSIGFESHSVAFSDFDNDGNLDAVMSVKPGYRNASDSNETIVFLATRKGFKKLRQESQAGGITKR